MILSDGNFQLGDNGLIKYQDILDLLNYYSDFFTVNIDSSSPANSNVLITIYNKLVETINRGDLYYDTNSYNQLNSYMSTFKKGSLIENVIFPALSWIPVYKTFELSQNTTFRVPKACNSITINLLISGGGGGAAGSGGPYGLYVGGSGASGGAYQNKSFDVTYNDTIDIVIGKGGAGPDNYVGTNIHKNGLDGTSSTVSKNNTILYSPTPGGGGNGTTAGVGGSPSGTSGTNGYGGRKHKEGNGQWGAASVWPNSAGARGGDSKAGTLGDPVGQPGNHGGGGGSGGYSYRGRGICGGGDGGDGYCSISMYCPKNWSI